jgi:hypothetical protein
VIDEDELQDFQEFIGETGTARDVLPSGIFWYNGTPNDSNGRIHTGTWSTLPTRTVDIWAFHVHSKPVRTESCIPWWVDRGIQYWENHRVLSRLPKW